ncbi:hypothetical protein PMAYCL1PPCAC_19447, partial [Pristionchus mayeri]
DCHESLVVNDCNGDSDCKSVCENKNKNNINSDFQAIMNDDKSLHCEDSHYVLRSTVYQKLQCTKEGWMGDDKSIIDFVKYPQNDINATCRS